MSRFLAVARVQTRKAFPTYRYIWEIDLYDEESGVCVGGSEEPLQGLVARLLGLRCDVEGEQMRTVEVEGAQ